MIDIKKSSEKMVFELTVKGVVGGKYWKITCDLK